MLWKQLKKWVVLYLISLCLQRVSFTVIFPIASVSLSGSERVAGEDGCNSGYCFGASESFVSKISVFFEYDVLLVYVLKRFRPGIQQVYKGFLRVLCPRFLLENPQSENLAYQHWSFFLCPASKKPTVFNYSTVWSSLIICSSLANARISLEFNIHIGKLRMPVVLGYID